MPIAPPQDVAQTTPANTATGSPAVVSLDKIFFEIRPPKELEKSPAGFARCLLALSQLRQASFFDRLSGKVENVTLEIGSINSLIHYYAVVPSHMANYFEGQIAASYPKAKVIKLAADYLHGKNLSHAVVKELALAYPYYFPINTYKLAADTDPLASVLGTLSKAQADEVLVFQINLANGGRWQSGGRAVIQKGIPGAPNADGTPTRQAHPQAALIEQKISISGFEVSMRLLSSAPDPVRAENNLLNLASSFGSLAVGEGNSLKLAKPNLFFRADHTSAFFLRNLVPSQNHQYLNVDEIATLYHLPDDLTSQIKNIAWGGESFNDPPQNLPVATGLTDEQKQNINFFAKTEYKNEPAIFGIEEGEDRRRHFYIIGKTGTGKTTLIANMAISDIRKDKGIAIIDPHGDLSEIITNYVPGHRINDVAYLDPANAERSFHLNPFEIQNTEDADIVASNFISIFQKLYSYSWGPRLEYILRNTVLTLVRRPGSTMMDIPTILTDTAFRKSVVTTLADPVLRNFWQQEYDRFAENFRQEAISPILNKIGQFLSSQRIRNIVGHEKSTVNLAEIMDQGKVMILNLSQGKLGEDNAALLGAVFITKFQLAAAARAKLAEHERRDFFLYVDEFQNFATTSFIKILSEARKYHLNLILANQYMAQLSEEIQKAIFGNVGTICSFVVGAADAKALMAEFGETIPDTELVALDKYMIALKLSIDGATSAPFLAHTLPLPNSSNQQKDKVLQASMERYTKPIVADIVPPVSAMPPPPRPAIKPVPNQYPVSSIKYPASPRQPQPHRPSPRPVPPVPHTSPAISMPPRVPNAPIHHPQPSGGTLPPINKPVPANPQTTSFQRPVSSIQQPVSSGHRSSPLSKSSNP